MTADEIVQVLGVPRALPGVSHFAELQVPFSASEHFVFRPPLTREFSDVVQKLSELLTRHAGGSGDVVLSALIIDSGAQLIPLSDDQLAKLSTARTEAARSGSPFLPTLDSMRDLSARLVDAATNGAKLVHMKANLVTRPADFDGLRRAVTSCVFTGSAAEARAGSYASILILAPGLERPRSA